MQMRHISLRLAQAQAYILYRCYPFSESLSYFQASQDTLQEYKDALRQRIMQMLEIGLRRDSTENGHPHLSVNILPCHLYMSDDPCRQRTSYSSQTHKYTGCLPRTGAGLSLRTIRSAESLGQRHPRAGDRISPRCCTALRLRWVTIRLEAPPVRWSWSSRAKTRPRRSWTRSRMLKNRRHQRHGLST